MDIAKDRIVTINYTLTDDGGKVIDSSKGREPLAYLHGAGNIIPGLEASLEGKSAGDNISVSIAPAKGYGERNGDLVQEVPRDRFPEGAEIRLGTQFQTMSPAGPQIVTVVGVTDEQVTVDGNHPLAGMNLNFEVDVVEVRQATAEELEHGHVHVPGMDHE
jgi:FKBP-type peptidyl-prolyl cis-trans isomerase SlyD